MTKHTVSSQGNLSLNQRVEDGILALLFKSEY